MMRLHFNITHGLRLAGRWLKVCAMVIPFTGSAQNLVPNGDLEQFSSCPTGLEQLDSAVYWFNPSDSGITLPGTPDYLNQCATGTLAHVPNTFIGYQPANSGAGYAGISLYHQSIADYREYMEVSLLATLPPGLCFEFSMYVNLGNGSRFTTDAIQVYLSDSAVSGVGNYYPLPFTPQLDLTAPGNFDTLNWQKVSTTFITGGNELYLIIGNFLPDSATSVTLANPSAFGNFIYCFIDDVVLSPCTGLPGNPDPGIRIYPTLFESAIHVQAERFAGPAHFRVTDAHGRLLLLRQDVLEAGRRATLDVPDLAAGVYFVEVITPLGRHVQKVLKGRP